MFIRIKKKSDQRISVQLVEAIREGTRIRQKIVRHIGVAYTAEQVEDLKNVGEFIKAQIEEERQPCLYPPEEIAHLRIDSRHEPVEEIESSITESFIQQQPSNDALMVDLRDLREESRSVVGIHDIYGKIFEDLQFHKIIPNPARHKACCRIIKNLVLARIANPGSKRDAVDRLEEDFGVSLNLNAVYQAMDALDDKVIETMKQHTLKATLKLFKEKVDVLFYDCTTLYFEAFDQDTLRMNGYSKDLKFNQPQVVLALCVTKEGIPVTYELFPGNMYEGATLIPALENLRKKFELDKVVFVADSGLLNEENLQFLEQNNYFYIVGARLKNMTQAIQKEILDETLYTSLDDGRVLNLDLTRKKTKEIQQDSTEEKIVKRLIVHYSPKRAQKDKNDRDKAIMKLKKKIKSSKNANPKDFLSNYGYKKYLKIEGEHQISIDQPKLDNAQKWDGLHGVVTNVDWLSDQEIVTQYKGLWQVEESFRIQKHDLKVRPIFHWKESRVKTHVALCYMAFACVRHLEYRLKAQYQKLSPEVIRRELIHVQNTIVRHQHTNATYVIPSPISLHAANIYRIMRMKRDLVPYQN
jgi:transposase